MAALAIDAHEVDPARWGEVYPRQFERFMMTARDGQATTYAGSEPYSKLERDPFLKTAYAGYGFALDYNEERGHHYAQIDQARSKRTTELKMPGACINCHAANAPALIEELGWERFNSTPYNDLRERLTTVSAAATVTTRARCSCGSPGQRSLAQWPRAAST